MGVVPRLDMEDSYVLVTALRLAQLLFTAVCTAITGYLINDTHPLAPGSVKACVNFLMFVCVLNWVVSVYGLVSRYVQSLAIPIVQLPLDVAGSIFALVGALVISIKLKTVDCTDPPRSDESWIAGWTKKIEDADNIGEAFDLGVSRCRTFQADDAFMYMLFVIGAVSLYFTYKSWRKGGGSSGGGVGLGGIV